MRYRSCQVIPASLASLTFLTVRPEEAPLARALVALHAWLARPVILARAGLLRARVRLEGGDLHGTADVLLLQDQHALHGDLRRGETGG